jgi:hypothetical protein
MQIRPPRRGPMTRSSVSSENLASSGFPPACPATGGWRLRPTIRAAPCGVPPAVPAYRHAKSRWPWPARAAVTEPNGTGSGALRARRHPWPARPRLVRARPGRPRRQPPRLLRCQWPGGARRAGQRCSSPLRRPSPRRRRLSPSRCRLRRPQPSHSPRIFRSPGQPTAAIRMSADAPPMSSGSSTGTCTGQITSYTAGLSFTIPIFATRAGVTSSGRTPPDGGSPLSLGDFPTTPPHPPAATKMPRLTPGGTYLRPLAVAVFGSRHISPWAGQAVPRLSPVVCQTGRARPSGRRQLRRHHPRRSTRTVPGDAAESLTRSYGRAGLRHCRRLLLQLLGLRN